MQWNHRRQSIARFTSKPAIAVILSAVAGEVILRLMDDVPSLDMTPVFLQQPDVENLFGSAEGYWTGSAHQLVADALIGQITAEYPNPGTPPQ